MNSARLRFTEYTRLAWLMSALVATATFYYLHYAYARLPLLVPVRFDDGLPSQFAFKSVGLIYLPFGLQLTLLVVFMAIAAVVMRRRHVDGSFSAGTSRQTAEAVALLAMVWVTFQSVNAWRLAQLYRYLFDAYQEIYVVAFITAITATVVIVGRAVLRVQDDGVATPGAASQLLLPVVDGRSPALSAALAAAVGVGIALPLLILASVWDGLRHI